MLCRLVTVVAVTLAAVTVGVGPAPPASAAPAGGWLDGSFGGGSVTVGPTDHDAAADVAVEPDGRVVVLANTTSQAGDVPIVVRLTPDGHPDPTFGIGGTVTLPHARTTDGQSLAVQADGKILVGGSQWSSDPTPQGQLFVARLLSDGQLDATFAGGVVTISSPVPGVQLIGGTMALASDGRVVLASSVPTGGFDYRTVIVRRLADGSPDPSFGTGGAVVSIVGVQPASVAVEPGGGVIVAGSGGMPTLRVPRLNPQGFALARFDVAGGLDTSFGAQGIAWTDFSRGSAPRDATLERIALQPDGRIVAVGWESVLGDVPNLHSRDVALARYRPDGALDPGFGAGGIVVTRNPPTTRGGASTEGASFGEALVVDPAGRIVVGATAVGAAEVDLVLVRYSPTGAADTTFGRQGWMKTDLGGEENLRGLALSPDGRPVVAATKGPWGSSSVVVDRYSGTPDVSNLDSWGWNAVGQLGDGTTADRTAVTPADLPSAQPGGLVALAGGGYHSLALRAGGTVLAWGWNGYGELGDGTAAERNRPVTVPGLSDVSAISAGLVHSLAVSGGRVYAWGWNGLGQLGDGTTVTRMQPVQVPGLSDVVAVAAGAYHSLALRIDGTVWAWGFNGVGQLGDGSTVNRLTPVQVPGVYRATAVAAGAFHSLAVASEDQAHDVGAVLAWGYSAMGQTGLPNTAAVVVPRVAYLFARPVAIAAGGYHSLLLTDDGRVLAWGWNGYGQLGDASTVGRPVPTAVPGLSDVTAIATGLVHSVAAGRDGQVRAWGWNGVGQLGDGTTSDRHAPVVVRGLTGATAVGAGAGHSVAALHGGP